MIRDTVDGRAPAEACMPSRTGKGVDSYTFCQACSLSSRLSDFGSPSLTARLAISASPISHMLARPPQCLPIQWVFFWIVLCITARRIDGEKRSKFY